MTITYHDNVIQGSEPWLQLRAGILTASEMKHVITPTLKVADNDKTRMHLYELLSQRVTNYVEPQYVSEDMLRGTEEEFYARQEYTTHFAPVTECGFITNDKLGFTIGYSPDGLVDDEGLIECKSRRQKYQVQTIADNAVPADYLIQIQTGLLISERQWLDFVSYCGGLPMFVMRVFPDPVVMDAIANAAITFEQRLAAREREYRSTLATMPKFIPTERRIEQEMYLG